MAEKRKIIIKKGRKRGAASQAFSFTRDMINVPSDSPLASYRISAWSVFEELVYPPHRMRLGVALICGRCPSARSTFQRKAHLINSPLCQKLCLPPSSATSTADKSPCSPVDRRFRSHQSWRRKASFLPISAPQRRNILNYSQSSSGQSSALKMANLLLLLPLSPKTGFCSMFPKVSKSKSRFTAFYGGLVQI